MLSLLLFVTDLSKFDDLEKKGRRWREEMPPDEERTYN
jgi:hypothetical protein